MNYDSIKDITDYLDNRGLSMKKRFGQNFLLSPNVRQKIINILEPGNDENIWEIGPGLGAMTHMLVGKTRGFTVFEIDHGFIECLREMFPGLSIVEGDFLKTWKDCKSEKPDKIIGNLPYCCSSAIIADIAYENMIPEKMVFTVQKELAERMISKPGSKNYSSFSVLCDFAYKVKYHGDIAGGAFFPVPEVTSSIVELEANEKYRNFTKREVFFDLVRELFKSRRKTIRNNIFSSVFAKKYSKDELLSVLEKCGVSPDLRAEVLDVGKFVKLAENL